MKCGKCGTELPPNSSFCPVCGNQMAGNESQPKYQYQQPQYQAQTPYQSQPQAPQGPVNTWLVPAILATIFCCLPFGIVAIVFASKANSALACHDYQLARENSYKAKTWFWVAFACGIVFSILWVLLQILVLAGSAAD